ncbi:MAG: hypothetical protein ACOZCO_05575 [Bacteroidota bacterium]
MKHIFKYPVFLLLATAFHVVLFSKASPVGLKMKITEDNSSAKNCSVKFFFEDSLCFDFTSGNIHCWLDTEKKYRVEISKPGFVTKIIYIDTHLHETLTGRKKIDMEIEMVKKDKSCFDEINMGTVRFDKTKGEFVHSDSYTMNRKAELQFNCRD